MNFYTDPSFFVIVGVLLVPAIVAGLMGRRAKTYGLVVSIAMVCLLFFRDLPSAVAFAVFFVVSAACVFGTLALFKASHPHKVALYRVLLALSIVPLVAAKVSAAFDANILGFVGISYLTFKNVQVLIETRDGLITEMAFIDYAYFLIFFPVFTSGPIMRSRDFIAQINTPYKPGEYTQILADGAGYFIRGIVYNFVLAAFFQWLMWFGPSAIGTATAGAWAASQLVECFCYGMYLFFDFAGYTLMVMGVGAALGVRVPPNFNAPFLAVDIKDFWNRWHLSLSYWLRDFVFMRVTRIFMKHKVFKSRLTTASWAYMVNFIIMGVWHGVTVNYFLYGIYQGLLLVMCDIFQKKSSFYKHNKNKGWFKFCSWLLTMVSVFFGFAFFSGQLMRIVIGA